MLAPPLTDSGELAFLAQVVVQASLPYRDPGECTYVRRNGDFTLTLQAPPDIGLPYGRYPRLLLAYLCGEAVRTRSREIRLGSSLRAFMEAVGVHGSGGKNGPWRRFQEQAARLGHHHLVLLDREGCRCAGAR